MILGPGVRTPRWILFLCLISVPSAFVAWHQRDIPQFGSLGDDALYLATAKSLATGQGYRIPSLPGDPAMTKYPPGYPLLLSLVWRIDPRFPENLPVAALLAWIMLPLLLTMARLEFAKLGLGAPHANILCVLLAFSASIAWFSMNLLPELAFLSILLAAMIVADSEASGWRAAGAGLLGGAAFLLKLAALPLLFTTPLLYLYRRRTRSAALFFTAMLPFVAGWMLWAQAHHGRADDSTWGFYSDYFSYQAFNIPLRDYPLVVWQNFKGLWPTLGELVAVPPMGGPLGQAPACVAATIALVGAALLARRKGVTHYHAFALGFLPVLVVWHYPPHPRLAFPLLPLLLAGLSTAALEAWRSVSERRLGARRVAAWSTLVTLAVLSPLAVTANYVGPLAIFYFQTSRDRRQRADLLAEYQWIKNNTPPDAAFVASDDSLLYLYTGRSALGLQIPPSLFYHADVPGIAEEYRQIGAFAARNHLRYLLRTPSDFALESTPALGRDVVDEVLADPRRFRLVHHSQNAAVYEAASNGTAR